MKLKMLSNDLFYWFFVLMILTWYFISDYEEISVGWRFFGMFFFSLLAGVAFLFFSVFLNAKINDWLKNRNIKSMCRNLCVRADSTDETDVERCWAYMIKRYSDELAPNRISNFIGILINGASWLVSILCIAFYIFFICWSIYNSDYSNPFVLWIPISIDIVFQLAFLLISFVCFLLFGRFPGEARKFNSSYDKIKNLDSFLSSDSFRSAVLNDHLHK